MAIPFAFLIVVIIWSTTPLAIQWSGDDVSFLFGLASRMVIGLSILLILHFVLRKPLRTHVEARRVYFVGGLGLYAAMTAVYWAARYIPTGWIAVVFGLTPVATSFMAAFWLNENAFTAMKILGKALGVSGLAVIFLNGASAGDLALFGILLVFLSVMIHSASTVWVKRLNPGIEGMEMTTGILLVATPLFVLTWLIMDGNWPAVIPGKTAGAIIYLGIMGSVIGFILFFHLLQRLPANRVALITLITPVIALWLGNYLNDEVISLTVTVGTLMILAGLASHELGVSSQNSVVEERVKL